MSFTLYDKQLTSLAANLPPLPRLKEPDVSATKQAPFCGSTITVDLSLENGKVVAYGHDVQTCLLGRAAASIMAHHIFLSSSEELKRIKTIARALLKNKEIPEIPKKWKEMSCLRAIKPYALRHASTLLVFETVCQALATYEEKTCEKKT